MSWSLQDAKNRFSAVVDAALAHEPQLVTRRGAPSVMVVAVEDYERLRAAAAAARPRFVDHLLAIPSGTGAGAEPEAADAAARPSARPRDVVF